jgi:hypothetical protein
VAKRAGNNQVTSTLDSTAQNLGSALGHLANRLDAWKEQRSSLVAEIRRVAETAQAMLGDLGHAAPVERVRKGGRKPGYTMSEATKAKLRAAWKRRSADLTQEVRKVKRTMSTEARAKIAAAQKLRWAQRRNG